VAVFESYLDAINRRQYARAYTYWSDLGAATGQTYPQFHQGFLTTENVTYRLGEPREGGAAGSSYTDVTALMVAVHTDRSTLTFCGRYTMRRANVPPFEQFGWRIYSGTAEQIANIPIDGAEAAQLLTGDCTQ
jgi:hypothetical protein